jgi:hypothetical protein
MRNKRQIPKKKSIKAMDLLQWQINAYELAADATREVHANVKRFSKLPLKQKMAELTALELENNRHGKAKTGKRRNGKR